MGRGGASRGVDRAWRGDRTYLDVRVEAFLIGEKGDNVVAVGRGGPVDGETAVEVLEFGEFGVGLGGGCQVLTGNLAGPWMVEMGHSHLGAIRRRQLRFRCQSC